MTGTAKRFSRTGIFTAALLVACLFVTWYAQKPILTTLVSYQLDRQVTVEELTRLSIGARVELAARNILVSHQPEDLLIEELDVTLDGWALFTGQLVIMQLSVSGLDLALPEPSDDEDPGKIALPTIQQWQANNVRLHYVTETGHPYALTVIESNGDFQSDTQQLQVRLSGNLNQLPFSMNANANLTADSQTPSQLELTWNNMELLMTGFAGDLATGRGTDLTLSLKADKTRSLLDAAGMVEVRDGPLHSLTSIKDLGSAISLKTKTTLGEFTADVSGSIEEFDLDEFDLSFKLAGPSLFEAGALLGYLQFEPLPFEAAGRLVRQNSQLMFRDMKIKLDEGTLTATATLPGFPELHGMTLELDGTAISTTLLQPVLGSCRLPDEPMTWYGRLQEVQPGSFEVDVSLTSPQREASFVGGMTWSDGNWVPNLNFGIQGFTLLELGHCGGVQDLPDLAVQIDGHLKRQNNNFEISDVKLNSTVVNVTGDLKIDADNQSIDAAVTLVTNNLAEASSALTAVDLPFVLNSSPASLRLKLKGVSDQLILELAEFEMGQAVARATGKLADPADGAGFILNLTFAGPDLREVIVDGERLGTEPQPFSLEGQLERRSSGEDTDWFVRSLNAQVSASQLAVDGELRRINGTTETDIRFEASGQNLENALGPWVDYPLPARPFLLDGSAQQSTRGVAVERLRFESGEHQLNASGFFDHPPDYSDSRGQLTLIGPSIHELMAMVGQVPTTLDRSYELSLTMDGNKSELLFSDIKTMVGESDISGSIAARQLPSDRWRGEFSLRSESMYLPLFFPQMEKETEKEILSEDREEAGEVAKTPSAKVFSNTSFDLSYLDIIDADFNYSVARLWSKPDQSTAITLAGSLNQGRFESSELTWAGETSIGEAKFIADTSNPDAAPSFALNIDSSRLPLVWLLAGEPEVSDAPTSYRANLTTQGSSPAALLANLSGPMIFRGGGGSVDTRLLDRLFGDFLYNISSSVLGTQNRRPSKINCTAGAVSIAKGQARFQPGLVIRSDRVDVLISGEIDLIEEKPNLGVITRSRKGIGLSPAKVIAPRLKVTGSLASPKLSVDSRGTALSTGMAFFSGGLSVLASGLMDRLITGAGNPCDSLYLEGTKLPAFAGIADTLQQ